MLTESACRADRLTGGPWAQISLGRHAVRSQCGFDDRGHRRASHSVAASRHWASWPMVLTQSSWISAPMAAIIEGALIPHSIAPGEICAQGPPVNLSARQALSLSMAIHELATNSTNYGALSVLGGEVTVRWGLEPLDGDNACACTGPKAAARPSRRPSDAASGRN